MEEQKKKCAISRALNELEPIHTFIFGIIGGILVLCTIGFFIMLSVFLDGEDSFAKEAAPTDNNAPTQVEKAAEYTLRDIDEKVDHIRGNKKAKITVVEYSDIECPFCNRFHATMKQVIDKYGDDVRWVLRHNPLDGLHANARKAAIATECAAEQGKFWELSDHLYETVAKNRSLDGTKFNEYASYVGMNTTKFAACLTSGKYDGKVKTDQADVSRQGTPFSVIVGPNGEEVSINGAQPFSVIEQAIQSML